MLVIEECTLKTMALDELWNLHRGIRAILAARLQEKKNEIEEQLRRLHSHSEVGEGSDGLSGRSYPVVLQKFRNPVPPHQTWSGRGRRPRWIADLLDTGISIHDIQLHDFQSSAI